LAEGLAVFRRLVSASVGAAVANRTYALLGERGSAERWGRSNHRGEAVTLAEGPAIAAGSLAGLLFAPKSGVGVKSAAMVGVAAAAALGALDDLTGATDVKGLRGHLGALRHGQVTTGSMKLFGLAATGLVAAALARHGRGGPVDAVLAGGVVAGSANLANLFDLRPGRASKMFLAAGAAPLLTRSSRRHGAFGDVVAPAAGAVAAVLGEDLAERSMMGDTGANALGAAWGVGAAASMSRTGLAATLMAIGALTVLSERVSFSQVIERTEALRYFDQLGRRSP
jgi:UDP-N-acetylmuramyl pentapeptide phosphotransferase/UDP-N-acetylglucosamine-1-phosphate transferase